MVSMIIRTLFYCVSALMIFLTCTTPISPFDCSKTEANFYLKTSNKSIASNVQIRDTVGDSIYYGFNTNLPNNIESVQIKKGSASDNAGSVLLTLKNVDTLKSSDTVWNSLFLPDTGVITITYIANLNCGGNPKSGTLTITVLARAPNHQPKLIVPRYLKVQPSAACSLTVTATDADYYQTLTFSVPRMPARGSFDAVSHIFKWQAPSTVGVDSVIFKVEDNGYPSLGDSQTVYLYVTSVDNTKPVLIVRGARNIKTGTTCTLTPLATDADAGQTLTYSLLKQPAGSAFNAGVFTWTPAAAFKGVDTAIFMVVDNGVPQMSDTEVVQITVSDSVINQPPAWKIKSLNLVDTVGVTLNLTLSNLATDPNGDTLDFILLSGDPAGDAIKNNVYSFTPAAADTGAFLSQIVAKDPMGLSDTLTIHLTVKYVAPVNHIPVLTVSGVWNIKTGTTCTLTPSATDTDAGQTLTYSLLKQPTGSTFSAGVFTWTPAATFKGVDTAIFMVVDNGVPPMSDTAVVQITVSDTVINHPPKWKINPLNLVATVGTTTNLTLSDKCADPEGDSITFVLLNGNPVGDTIKNSVYSFMPMLTDTGAFSPQILAKDPMGLSDTLTVHLTVTAGDRQAPYIKLFSPTPDSSIVGTSSVTVKVVCKDSSGVASVKCSMGTDTFAVLHTDSTYSASATSLKTTGVNEILFIATDASVNANRDTLKVHVRYVLPGIDSVGPSITLVTPSKDSVTTNSSSYTVTLKCTDASGVLSVNGAMGSTPFTGTRDTGANWKINVNGLAANTVNTVVFTATDSSVRANKSIDTLYIKSVIVNPFTITFDKNDAAATGTMTAQTIASGATAALSANTFTKAGYTFSGWATSSTGAVVYADQVNYTMGTANVTLYAKWTALPTYSLTYNGNTNTGGAVPATVTGIVSGTSVTVATAATLTKTNYNFSGWNTAADGSGIPYAGGASITITANTTLYAQWTALPTYSVIYNANGATSGSVPTDTNHYKTGTKVTVLGNTGALARTGYNFAGWNAKGDGSGTSYTPADTFTMGTSNDTLYVRWTQKVTFVLTITAANGSVTKDPNLTAYDSGTVVTLTPVPATGYHFSGWSGALTGSTNPATITMNGAKSVTAAFAVNPPNTFTLTVSATNGTVKKTPDLPQYDSGSSVGLKATAATGYHFVNWSGDATGTSDSTTILMAAARNVTANFAINTYQLTVAAGTGGTITAPTTSPATVNYGVATTITAAPSAGYTFANWTVTNGTATITSATSATTTVTLTSGNATVTANFIINTYSLTVQAGTGGSITAPTGPFPVTVNSGAATTITASPNANYSFVNWTVTTGTATIANASAASTTVTLTSGNATVTANFILNTYQLTVAAGTGGSITAPTGTFPKTVNSGAATTITASPNANYSFVNWTVTTGTATIASATSATTTVTLTSGNATVTANFTPITYTLTMSNDGHGTTTPTGTTTVNQGAVTSISATPSTCYQFSSWSITSGTATIANASAASTTVTLSSGNAAIRANFTINQYTVSFYSPNQNTVYSTSSVSCGSTVSAPTTVPTQTCSTFVAWYTNTSHTTQYSFPTAVTSSFALYAGWTTKTNLVTFHTGTSAVIPPQSVPCGGKATAPSNPYLTCNNFGGWYTDQTYSTQWNFNNIVASPMDLYAKWTLSVSITNPANATMCSVTGSATLSVTGTGATAYQWYDDQGNPLISDNKYYNGAQTANLNFTYMVPGTSSYYCIASNGSCYSPASQPATLTVNPMPNNDNIQNSSWYNQQGPDVNSGNFWVQVSPPDSTTEYIIITNLYESGFSGTFHYTSVNWPAVCGGYYGYNGGAGFLTVEYWTVNNYTGCESIHQTWTNPSWGN